LTAQDSQTIGRSSIFGN